VPITQRLVDSMRTAALCSALLAVGGCLPQLIPELPPPPRTYDFGPLSDERPSSLPLRVRVEAVTAPSWLNGFEIHYRRLDEQPGALRAYAQSQWIAPAPELFAERLRHRLSQAAPEAPGRELVLRLEILSFEQVFERPDQAYAVSRARASLNGLAGGERRRELERRRPTAASVQGATAALPAVADDMIDALLDWLRELGADQG
jgi:cholesterol transport system auxiliary component